MPTRSSSAWRAGKRAFDIAFAMAALLALVPILAVVALAIVLDSPGPVLFRQRRIGRGLRPFTVIKFRTMRQDSSPELHRRYIESLVAEHGNGNGNGNGNGGLKKMENDPRITRVGRVLRRLSLDELPQFLNVVAGTMSLIGPRPALEYELDHYQPDHFERFAVRPGLSGLWQVSGRNQLDFNDMLELDVEYVRSSSLRTDARVLARTPQAMFSDAA